MPELTTLQIKFLSKYLQIVPKTGRSESKKKRHKDALDANEFIKANFKAYEDKKRETDLIAGNLKSEIDDLAAMLGDLTQGRGGKPMQDFRDRLASAQSHIERLSNEISVKHTNVMKAPENEPIFGKGVVALDQIIVNLNSLHNKLPTPPALLNDGIIGALYSARKRVRPLRIFADNSFLNEKIVHAKLPNKPADTIRKNSVNAHLDACNDASAAISDLINPILNKRSDLTSDQASNATARIFSDLMSARKPHINELIRIIKANAQDNMAALVLADNDVAKRESGRSDKITSKVAKLQSQMAKLALTINGLKTQQAKAQGFNEKQALSKKYSEAVERLEGMQGYAAQLGAYDDELALRMERIQRAVDENAKGLTLANDVDSYIDSTGAVIEPMTGPNSAGMLLGSADENGNPVNGIYDNLLAKFTRASERVTVDVKLFLGEVDLFDISKKQFETLKAMLDAGHELAVQGEKAGGSTAEELFGKAKYIFGEADRIYGIFNGSNKFPFPAVPETKQPEKDRIALVLKNAAVELDRFWGIGGDDDGSIRDMLADVGDAFETACDGNVPLDFTATETLIKLYQKAFDSGRDAFQPSPQDQQAKKEAGAARDKMVDGLLLLYKTKPLQESQISDVPMDHLLVIERNGKREYYEILSKGNGNEINRRENKVIPRETMNQLLEQATMLEMLAQSDAPDCAEAIKKAVEESEAKLTATLNGEDSFKAIAKRISECKALLDKKTLAQWIPANLQAITVEFETFKEVYATKYLPDEGKLEADELHKKISQLIVDSDKVREDYVKADAIMVQVEKDFNNSKGAAKPNLAAELKSIINAGADALAHGYASTPPEMDEMEQLLDDMKASLKKLGDGKDSAIDGDLKQKVKSARQSIETKSKDGIKKGKDEAEAIKTAMADQLKKIEKPVNLQYLRNLNVFLGGQATAVEESKKALKEMLELQEKVEERLIRADNLLFFESTETLKSYKEFKTIYSTLNDQAKTAKKGYKTNEDVKSATSEYKNIHANISRLVKDLKSAIRNWEPDQKAVKFSKFQGDLETAIHSVRRAAVKASETAISEAADDEQQVITLTATAAKTLALAGGKEIKELVKLRDGLQDEADTALATKDKSARVKLLGTVREKALAEVRRIRTATENHPALKIYRDNPFVKDVSWPIFASTLHDFEVQILTTLQPR